MFNRIANSIIIIFILAAVSLAQPEQRGFSGRVNGRVIDSVFDYPIPLASIILYKQSDKTKIMGIATDDNGRFLLEDVPPGTYYAEISFIGYQKKTLRDLKIVYNVRPLELGDIKLQQIIIEGESVEVTTEKPAIEYKIDKKVVNVDQLFTAASGTAVDVLKTVPSVSTDIDGNVTLRGSSNFNLLIDGRPTPLETADALEQIPASSIDNIEIITNPSVRYSPEGESGIINIILKRKQLPGESGMVNVNGGNYGKYGGDFLWSIRRGGATYNINGSYNRHGHIESIDNEQISSSSGDTTQLLADGSEDRAMTGYNLRGEALYQLGEKNRVGFNLSLGGRKMEGTSDLDYSQTSSLLPDILYYTSGSDEDMQGRQFNLGADFQHKFAKKNHEITGIFTYGGRNMKGDNSNYLLDNLGSITSGQINKEEGPGRFGEIQLNYVNPIADSQKIETGYQARIGGRDEDTGFSEYDTTTANYIYYPQYSHQLNFNVNVHALYIMYSREMGRFGFQTGIRGEYTYRVIDYLDSLDVWQDFTLDRWDYYPSAHISYEFNDDLQFMTSYTRRVNPLRPWLLEPFITWEDAFNVQQGNPNLKPEIIDSYEIGLQKMAGRGFIACDIFHRTTHDYIERAQSAYKPEIYDNVILTGIENIGFSYATGIETTVNQKLLHFWDCNLTGSLYDYRISGKLFGASVDEKSYSWNVKLNNSFALAENTKFQLNADYRSPTITSQGKNKGFLMTDLALKQEFMNKKVSATLQVAGLFGGHKRDTTKDIPGLYIHNYEAERSPSVSLTLSYIINNYKPNKKKQQNGNGEGEEEF